MWAVVPLKSCNTAKSRLSSVLDPYERKRLYLAMARQVIETLKAVPGIENVAIVTRDSEVVAFAERLQVKVLRQQEDAGTAHACRLAVDQLRATGLHSLLMISGDLPLISVSSIERFMQFSAESPTIAIAPDRHRTGTNALLCAPPDAIPICFGPGSLAMHLAAARERNVKIAMIESDELALDIDTPDDLRRLRSVLANDPGKLSAELQDILAVQTAVAERA